MSKINMVAMYVLDGNTSNKGRQLLKQQYPMAKKFWVSMAVNVPHNWEVVVEAEDEREAFEKAHDMFEDNSEEGSLVDVDDAEITLDLGSPDDDKDPWNPDGTSGVAIEERK